MKRTKKNIVALLVALCMLVSIIPAMSAPVAQATDAAQQVINFQWKQDAIVPVTSATFDAGYDWQVNELKTSTALYGTLGAVGDSLLHPSYVQIGFRGANTCLALDFKVKEAGYYSLDITTLDLSSADFSANAAVTIDEVALGNVIQKTDSDSATSEHAQNGGIIYLSAGEHTIVFTLQSAGADAYSGNMYFKYMTLTPTEKPNAEPEIKGDVDADSAFGTAYAYVEEHKDGTFKVTFVGGVDELEGFKAIGYEITVDSGEAAYVESNSVYKSLRIGEDVHNAAEYGGEFIFIGSQGNVKAGSKVTAKPYGVDANNNKVFHGVELTLQF